MDETEQLTLVNDRDQPIGTIDRKDISQLTPLAGPYIRAVNAFIIRADGKIWTPTRSMHKKMAPGGLDYSVGAHVGAGEGYLDALVREFSEEAGLKIDPSDCTEVAYNTPSTETHQSIYFSKLFVYRTDQQPTLSDEHVGGEFLDLDTIIGRIIDGAVVKGRYLEDLKILRSYTDKEKR